MANKYQTIMERIDVQFPKFDTIPPPATEEQLDEIEAKIGYSLPADYREFLRDYGGCVVTADYPVQDQGRTRSESVSNFYGEPPDRFDLALSYHDAIELQDREPWVVDLYPGLSLVRSMEGIEEFGWPEELLPIADSGGGSAICIALFGLRPGAIFFWRNAPHPGENLYLVASSFDEFMHLLQG